MEHSKTFSIKDYLSVKFILSIPSPFVCRELKNSINNLFKMKKKNLIFILLKDWGIGLLKLSNKRKKFTFEQKVGERAPGKFQLNR